MRYYQIKELLDLKPDSQSVTLKGWVKTFRSNRFISLNDGSSQQSIQCVVDFENTDHEHIEHEDEINDEEDSTDFKVCQS